MLLHGMNFVIAWRLIAIGMGFYEDMMLSYLFILISIFNHFFFLQLLQLGWKEKSLCLTQITKSNTSLLSMSSCQSERHLFHWRRHHTTVVRKVNRRTLRRTELNWCLSHFPFAQVKDLNPTKPMTEKIFLVNPTVHGCLIQIREDLEAAK